MIFGVYQVILDLYINILTFDNLLNVIFYFSGFGFGVIVLAKFLTFVLKRYRKILYISILGFMLGAILSLFRELFSSPIHFNDLLLGFFFLFVGYIVSDKLNHLF